MTDLITRLRGSQADERTYMQWQHEIMCEAAEEIERLQARVKWLEADNALLHKLIKTYEEDNEPI
jgi:hypothetical protein